MRIISGTLKGRRISPPKKLPVRPTTDLSKESLFNILTNTLDYENCDALDLFAGTGNISFELASRGCKRIVSVDKHLLCCKFIIETCKALNIETIEVVKSDVFFFLKDDSEKYDFIFADPPYDLDKLIELPGIVLGNNLLKPAGIFVIEHSSTIKLGLSDRLIDFRKYGQSAFSFFQ